MTDEGEISMPPEEHNQMHAAEPNTGKNNLIEQTTPACVYSVETLMALQKMLENGIPQPGERLPRSTQRSASIESNPQNLRAQLVATITERKTSWKDYLRGMFLQLRRSKEADKGHSAQQNG
jgi:hypothetical protein